MHETFLEHANITVTNSVETAKKLCDLFGWHIRWQGPAKDNGHTVHVGSETSYLALYTQGMPDAPDQETYSTRGGLNHVGIVVADLDAVEAKILAAGYKTNSHADYEPGRRFYFDNEDGIEFEIISYQQRR